MSGKDETDLEGLSDLGVQVVEQATLERAVHDQATHDLAEKEREHEHKRLVRIEAQLLKKRELLDKAEDTADRARTDSRRQNAIARAERLSDEIAQLESDRAAAKERIQAASTSAESTVSEAAPDVSRAVKQEPTGGLASLLVPRRRAAVAAALPLGAALQSDSAPESSTESDADSDAYQPPAQTAQESAASEVEGDADFEDDGDLATIENIRAQQELLGDAYDDGDEAAYQERVYAWCTTRWRMRRASESNEPPSHGDLLEEPYLPDPETDDHEIRAHNPTKPSLRVPRQIWDRLLGYQKAGLRWMFTLHQQNAGGVLGDEMGLGKTVQVAAFLAALYHSRLLNRPSIIVCPATLMRQWVREFHAWWPVLRVSILHNTGYAIRHGADATDDSRSEFPYNLSAELGNDNQADIWELARAADPRFNTQAVDSLGIGGSSSFVDYDSSEDYEYDAYGSRIRRKRKPRGTLDWRKRQKQKRQQQARNRRGTDAPNKASRENLLRASRLVSHIQRYGHIIIVTYTGLQIYQDALLPHRWGYAVLDEGHMIRNPDAEATLVCKRLDTRHRIIATGTPIQNNLTELWSLFDFVFPGRLGTLPVFNNQFAVPITLGGYATAGDLQVRAAYRCACILRDLIDPYLLRRIKADVASDLPKKSEHVLFCRLTEMQRAAYKAFLSSGDMEKIMDGKLQMLFGVDVARKICDHPDLLLLSTLPGAAATHRDASRLGQIALAEHLNTSTTNTDSEDELAGVEDTGPRRLPPDYGDWRRSGKLTILHALLEMWQPQGHKVLIFSQTRQMLDIIERMIAQMPETKYRRMDGTTPVQHRTALVDEFNCSPDIFVFLLTTKVGGLGINLTGADRVVLFSPDWNPSSDTQARERAWRLGQQRSVAIYRLMTAGTIEEKIYNRQIYKQFLSRKILEDPKQKRFFHSQSIRDLFSLTDFDASDPQHNDSESVTDAPADGSLVLPSGQGTSAQVTETGRMFANAQLYPSNLQRSSRSSLRQATGNDTSTIDHEHATTEDTTVDTNTNIDSIDGIVRLEEFRPSEGDDASDTNGSRSNRQSASHSPGTAPISSSADAAGEDEDRVLQSLFQMSGVHSALQHDAIVGSKDGDSQSVDQEASRIAQSARNALRDSQRSCRQADVRVPTWTGVSGHAGMPTSTQPGSSSVAPPPSAILSSERPVGEQQLHAARAVGRSQRKPLPLATPHSHGISRSGSVQKFGTSQAPSSANLLATLKAKTADMGTVSGSNRVSNAVDGYNPRTHRSPMSSSQAPSEVPRQSSHVKRTQHLPLATRGNCSASSSHGHGHLRSHASPQPAAVTTNKNIDSKAAILSPDDERAIVERIRKLLTQNGGEIAHRALVEEFKSVFPLSQQSRLKELALRVADLISRQPQQKVNRTGVGRIVQKIWMLKNK
ncbi:DNA repair protein rhp26 [Coemansia sp. RSA 1365]|nr:DNA repair protein rhp26 [Coemansia sp. RSA 1365]